MTVLQVVQALRAHLVAVLGPSGWALSPVHIDVMAEAPENLRHLGFAVGTPTSLYAGLEQGNAPTGSARVRTSLVVRWAYRMAPNLVIDGSDAQLAAEQTLVLAVLACPRTGPMHLAIDTAARTGAADGWVICDLRVTATHHHASE